MHAVGLGGVHEVGDPLITTWKICAVAAKSLYQALVVG